MGKWIGGGVEAVVMNYYRNINRNKIQFDFICDDDSKKIPYEEINALGGRVILIPPYQRIFTYQKKLECVLRKGKYKIVHSHINTLSIFPLRIAKKVGVPVRIAHSHSTSSKKELKKSIIKYILKPFATRYPTDFCACSEHAGRWLFGNKIFEEGKVTLINNGIDIDKFLFNENIRKKIRTEMNFRDDDIVIGHVGRFVKQKNHEFLIDIFQKLHSSNPNYKLLLIGQGPLEEIINKKVTEYELTNDSFLVGQKDNVFEYYQAMDIFVFPSLYEGLGMALIEAQIAGLPCITSFEVPRVAKVSDNFFFEKKEATISEWIEAILNTKMENRNVMRDVFIKCGYDIKNEAGKLEDLYIKLISN